MLNNKAQAANLQVPIRPDYHDMLDQVMQATETLLACWKEHIGLDFEDDSYVKDAASALESIRSERREYDRAMQIWLGLKS